MISNNKEGGSRSNVRTSFGGGPNSCVLSDARKAADQESADPHADGAPVEGPTAANSIKREYADESGELECLSVVSLGVRCGYETTDHVGNIIETSNPQLDQSALPDADGNMRLATYPEREYFPIDGSKRRI